VKAEYELVDVPGGEDDMLVFIKDNGGSFEAYGVTLQNASIVTGSDRETVIERSAGLTSSYFDKYS
jgi:hypothetical protein